MIRPLLLFLLSLCVFVSCKERTDDKGNSILSDTIAIKKEIPEPKNHPAEERIAFYLSEIERFRGNEYDSLEEANKTLMEYLKTVCADETSLRYPFDSLNKYPMKVLTSEDNRFRIYCWDTETGGTMHFYNAIFQYKTEHGSAAYVLNDISDDEPPACGVWFTELHTIHANNGSMCYLPIYFGRFSSNDHSNGISAYTIEGNKLNDTLRLFKPLGKPLYEIAYEFMSGREDKRSADNHISLSSDKKTLSIPITDEHMLVTESSLIYKFDGNQFVYDKNAR